MFIRTQWIRFRHMNEAFACRSFARRIRSPNCSFVVSFMGWGIVTDCTPTYRGDRTWYFPVVERLFSFTVVFGIVIEAVPIADCRSQEWDFGKQNWSKTASGIEQTIGN